VTEIADRYRRRADAFLALVDRTPPEAWSRPSPCAGWLARDVVAHVVDFSAHVLHEKAGKADLPAFADFADPSTAFRATRTAVERVLDDPATPAELARYLDLALGVDLPQHGWDLAKATGQDATIDRGEIDALWTALTEHPGVWAWQRANGWYADPVPVAEDAPRQDRVLGLLGRDPAWAAPPENPR
jgi:uncharacterized protein (TIGR03086 family)